MSGERREDDQSDAVAWASILAAAGGKRTAKRARRQVLAELAEGPLGIAGGVVAMVVWPGWLSVLVGAVMIWGGWWATRTDAVRWRAWRQGPVRADRR